MVPSTPPPAEASDTLWLTDDQQHVWRSWLSGAARIQQHLDRALGPAGLTIGEYEILVVLSEAPRWECRMAQLADQVHQSRSRLTHTAARMEAAGWVQREPAPGDGRGVVARLTPEGYAFLVQVAPAHVQSVRDIFVDVVSPADFQALGRAMDAVLATPTPEAARPGSERGARGRRGVTESSGERDHADG